MISTALGFITYGLEKNLLIPAVSRFLVGFCATPFILGLWTVLVSTVWPGASRSVFILCPVLIALGILIWYSRCCFTSISLKISLSKFSFATAWPYLVAITCALLVVFCVIGKLQANAQAPVIDHDACYYLGEALPFAESRSFNDMNSFRGAMDGTLHGDNHGPLWPAYLSHALMMNGNLQVGYPNDQAMRLAFQVTFLYMLLALVTLGNALGTPVVAAISILLILQIREFEYISLACSRDGFRIIPILLLVTVLTGLSPAKLREDFRPTCLIPVMVLSAFSLQGHTIGGFLVVCIALAWVAWFLLEKVWNKRLLLVIGALILGLLLGGTHYIASVTETGNFRGDNTGSGAAIAGTPLKHVAEEVYEKKLKGIETRWERLVYILASDPYQPENEGYSNKLWVNLLGLVGAFSFIVVGFRFKRRNQNSEKAFLGLITLSIALPFTGIFDVGNEKLSEYFVTNFRYPLHWYAFTAVASSSFIIYCCTILESSLIDVRDETQKGGASSGFLARKIAVSVLYLGLTILVIWISFSAWETVSSKWRVRTFEDFEKHMLKSYIEPAEMLLEQMPAGERLLTSFPNGNYYLSKPAMVLTTRPTWEIIKARSENDVEKALKEDGIGAVILEEGSIPGYYDRIPLYDYLNNPQKSFLYWQNERYRGYVLLWDQKYT